MTPNTVIRRTTVPSSAMVFVLVMLIILPTAYIAYSDYYTTAWYHHSENHYRDAARLALFVSVFFCAFLFAGLAFAWMAARVAPRVSTLGTLPISAARPGSVLVEHDGRVFALTRIRILYWVGAISALSMWVVFVTGGYEKIAQYGQEIGKLEYRLIGANDRDRVVTAIIQVARRLVLPFCVVYFTALRFYGNGVSLKYLVFLNVSLFVGVIMTLDRGPLMLMILMYFYISYMKTKSMVKLSIIMGIMFASVIILGGVMTYLQYNLQDFSFGDAVSTGLNFISNRAVMAPNFVPIELSYGLFDLSSDKLNMRYSRLLSLFTGNYVGTLQDASLYVGPVGAIADIWRNLGLAGIMFIGFALGLFFAFLDVAVRALDPVARGATTFTVISLTFYFYYGTFFSQGVFLQIFFLLAVVRFFRRDSRHYAV